MRRNHTNRMSVHEGLEIDNRALAGSEVVHI